MQLKFGIEPRLAARSPTRVVLWRHVSVACALAPESSPCDWQLTTRSRIGILREPKDRSPSRWPVFMASTLFSYTYRNTAC